MPALTKCLPPPRFHTPPPPVSQKRLVPSAWAHGMCGGGAACRRGASHTNAPGAVFGRSSASEPHGAGGGAMPRVGGAHQRDGGRPNPQNFSLFAKDRRGPPLGTTNRQPPTAANRHQPPTANRRQLPTANRQSSPTTNRQSPATPPPFRTPPFAPPPPPSLPF